MLLEVGPLKGHGLQNAGIKTSLQRACQVNNLAQWCFLLTGHKHNVTKDICCTGRTDPVTNKIKTFPQSINCVLLHNMDFTRKFHHCLLSDFIRLGRQCLDCSIEPPPPPQSVCLQTQIQYLHNGRNALPYRFRGLQFCAHFVQV